MKILDEIGEQLTTRIPDQGIQTLTFNTRDKLRFEGTSIPFFVRFIKSVKGIDFPLINNINR